MNKNDVEEHKLRARLVVKGFVQGVGYRNFVMRIARTMDIIGESRNLPNGDVEIFCKCKNLAHLTKFMGEIDIKNPGDLYSPTVTVIEKYTDPKHIKEHDPPKKYEIFNINYGDIPEHERELLIKMDTGSVIMQNMHKDMNNSFNAINTKYDSFGKDLKTLTKCIERFVKHYIKN